MISSGGKVLMLLVSLAAAAEVYDGTHAVDLAYQEDNDIDTGPFDLQPVADPNDVVLYRLLTALPREQPSLQFRPNWHDPDTSLEPRIPLDLKQAVYKRLPSALRSQPARPQQKWKIKKGKALGSMVCYFKLCAFRPH